MRIVIIGAGFGGLGAAIHLRRQGFHDLVICERDEDVGGTWWANTYPGCQCDIPSHLYSFSFALNPSWSRTYPEQPEIRRYLREVAERFGLLGDIRFGCEITAAEWDEEATAWHLETTQGPLDADVVIAAPGPLNEPKLPAVPGLDDFAGALFHTARWDHGHDLAGRRVAVVGTGASAIQVVPRIQPEVSRLTVFQRTPPWVVPHGDRRITDVERRLYRRFPPLQRLNRAAIYWARELLVPGLAYRPQLMRLPERLARRHLARQVPDPELRERLTPDYTIGCKRILPSNDWYPALTKPNVDLVTDPIEAVEPRGIRTAGGRLHELDTIVLATGFHVTDVPLAQRVRGTGGVTMSEQFAGSPEAYLGTTFAGFPNLFFLVGPNTGLGHNSIVFMIEAQLRYVLDALRTMRARGLGRLEVRREAHDAYNAEMQRRLAGSVWNTGGCSSWYLDANGRNTTIWPGFTWRYWQRTRRFDPEAYLLAPAQRLSASLTKAS